MFRFVVTVLVFLAVAVPTRAGGDLVLSAPLFAAQGDASKLNGFAVALIGLLVLLSVYWMYRLVRCDLRMLEQRKVPTRMVIPLLASVAILAGVVAHAHFAGAFTLPILQVRLGKAVIVCVLLCLKSYCGPLFTGYVASSQVYTLLEHGQLAPVPLLFDLLEQLLDFGPARLAFWVFLGQLLYSVLSSAFDLLDE